MYPCVKSHSFVRRMCAGLLLFAPLDGLADGAKAQQMPSTIPDSEWTTLVGGLAAMHIASLQSVARKVACSHYMRDFQMVGNNGKYLWHTESVLTWMRLHIRMLCTPGLQDETSYSILSLDIYLFNRSQGIRPTIVADALLLIFPQKNEMLGAGASVLFNIIFDIFPSPMTSLIHFLPSPYSSQVSLRGGVARS
ncbi:hypothetical protein HOY82DRAFT_631571 [Tuber indicum]|nr:hypothetical protein HOY82DRAFT_631571 [Tuber indicum]